MTTLQNLIDRTQNLIADTTEATWTEAQLAEWLRDAIRDYSLHFPRLRTHVASTSTGVTVYALPADFLAAYAVQYPNAADPPTYLQPRPFTHEDTFWTVPGYYAILPRRDDTDTDEIWLSESPSNAGMSVIYYAQHDATIGTGGTLTVPDRHHHILIAYAVWRASQYLQMAEQQAPTSNSSLLMAQLAQNTVYLKREYHDALAKALAAAAGQPFALPVTDEARRLT